MDINLNVDHPDGLFCPICGCGEIYYWPELVDWDKWDDKKKRSYENCPACGYSGLAHNWRKQINRKE